MKQLQRTLLAGAIVCAFGSSASAATTIAATSFPSLERLPMPERHHTPFASSPLADAVLASKRGGDASSSGTLLAGSVSSNQASNVVTGANSISDGAFAGAAGVSTVIQNSGNNVLIQNATIVNVQMK